VVCSLQSAVCSLHFHPTDRNVTILILYNVAVENLLTVSLTSCMYVCTVSKEGQFPLDIVLQ